MTNPPKADGQFAGPAIAALAVALGAVSMATSGDFFRSAMLGIAALLVLNVLLWIAIQVWPEPAQPLPPPPHVEEIHDEPSEQAGQADEQGATLALREEGA